MSRPLPDSAGEGPALLKRTDARAPMISLANPIAGLAWLSVDSLCGLHYEVRVIFMHTYLTHLPGRIINSKRFSIFILSIQDLTPKSKGPSLQSDLSQYIYSLSTIHLHWLVHKRESDKHFIFHVCLLHT